MATASHISKTLEPVTQEELRDQMRSCFAAGTAMYPVGGGTSLDFGLPAQEKGIALSLATLNRVVDFPARDMTITVEAGITMRTLAETLATEKQQLPVDVPAADRATVGGVVATNCNGARRYGYGSLRDYVIGILAIDGRGTPFKGGGRVVKNVAGYDFCKLLTGSLGTLGVISHVTLRLRPIAERSVLVTCKVDDLSRADQMLAALVHSETTPAAIELLGGPEWSAEQQFELVVGLEGTAVEVSWMIERLQTEWRANGVVASHVIEDAAARDKWLRIAEFAAAGESPLVVKASVVPSGVTPFIAAARAIDAQCSLQAHAGNGIVFVKFAKFPTGGLSRTLVAKLQTVAAAHRGNVIVLSNPGGTEMTHQSVWGGVNVPFALMTEVKKQFDPKNLLNPGRFVYSKWED